MRSLTVVVVVAVAVITLAQDLKPCDELVAHNCGAAIQEGQRDEFILSAAKPRWPADGFCTAFGSQKVSPPFYAVSVELFNQSPNVGHPGVTFNVKDDKNFDFIYFRPHSPGSCYQIGKVVAGTLKFGPTSKCPQGAVPHQKWFKVSVSVKGKRATAYLNGKKVVCWTTLSPTLGKGGVGACNGYKNVIRFRNFTVTSL